MRFLSMIRVDETTGQQPSQRLMDEMMALVGELSAAGVLLDTAGLLPSSHGARVRSQHGRITVTDGPFAEAREVIGGYAILKADSLDIVELIMDLEQEFNIEIPDEELPKVQTVSDIVGYLDKK